MIEVKEIKSYPNMKMMFVSQILQCSSVWRNQQFAQYSKTKRELKKMMLHKKSKPSYKTNITDIRSGNDADMDK